MVCLLLAALLVVGLVSVHEDRAQVTAIGASLQRIEVNQGVLIREANSIEVAHPPAVVAPTAVSSAPKPKPTKPKASPKPCCEPQMLTVMDQTVVCCCAK